MLGCEAVLYEWVESYDSKDWDRLGKCIAPTLRVSDDVLLANLPPPARC